MAGRRATGLPIIFLLALGLAHLGATGEQSSANPAGGGADGRVVRVHHLHFLVDDPIVAMQTRADKLGGTLVPLPGIGAGVRIGSQYLLFDRGPQTDPRASVPGQLQTIFAASATWLSDHGVAVSRPAFGDLPATLVSDALPLDHVGFASPEFATTVAHLVTRGAPTLTRTADAAMFALPNGNRVEIVRDTATADAYWCPMHPGVRSGSTGTCPLCLMELVPIRPPRIGEYQMDVTVLPRAQPRGLAGLRLVLRDPSSGTPVSDLLKVHEKPLHLFIVSRDLEYFAHVHPEPTGPGRFTLEHEVPPGEYMLIADFLPRSGTSQMVHRVIVAPGPQRRASLTEVPAPPTDIPGAESGGGNPTWGSAEKAVDGVRIRLEAADLVAGQIGVLRFRLFSAADGTPTTDLEPYLGAPGHMLMTNATLTDAVHGHPEESGVRTSVITFKPVLPAPGIAKLWLQFQRKGKVTTASFVINVVEP